MSVSPDTTADVLQQNMPLDATERDMMIAAIRADRQQFAPYINMIRKAIVNTEKNPMLGYLPLMIVAAQFADVVEDGMVEK